MSQRLRSRREGSPHGVSAPVGQARPITGYYLAIFNDSKFAETVRNPAWQGRQHFASVSVVPADREAPCVLLTLSGCCSDRSKALSYVPKKHRVIESIHAPRPRPGQLCVYQLNIHRSCGLAPLAPEFAPVIEPALRDQISDLLPGVELSLVLGERDLRITAVLLPWQAEYLRSAPVEVLPGFHIQFVDIFAKTFAAADRPSPPKASVAVQTEVAPAPQPVTVAAVAVVCRLRR